MRGFKPSSLKKLICSNVLFIIRVWFALLNISLVINICSQFYNEIPRHSVLQDNQKTLKLNRFLIYNYQKFSYLALILVLLCQSGCCFKNTYQNLNICQNFHIKHVFVIEVMTFFLFDQLLKNCFCSIHNYILQKFLLKKNEQD